MQQSADTTAIENALNALVATSGKIVQVDEATGSITYVGYADPGTASSSPLWQIFRLDESSDPELVKLYADGDTDFDNVWDDRASLSYS